MNEPTKTSTQKEIYVTPRYCHKYGSVPRYFESQNFPSPGRKLYKTRVTLINIDGRRDGLMVSALDSGSRGLGSRPCWVISATLHP